MTKKELRERWKTEAFWSSVQPGLIQLFEGKRLSGPLDLQGIQVGDGPNPMLHRVNFAGCELSHVDLSRGDFSVPFDEASLREVAFIEADFDRCTLLRTKMYGCTFDKARMIVALDDALFERCHFEGTRLRAAGNSGLGGEFGGKRVLFQRCIFRDANFQRIHLRASRFVDCQFHHSVFERCDLRGARFEGCIFSETEVRKSLLTGASFTPQPPRISDCET